MIEAWSTAAVLAAGALLLVIAQRRQWAPSLTVTLGVGIALRVVVLVLAQARGWQPYDFWYDFRAAGQAVLQHRDPLTSARAGGWHFLPPMAYVIAAELKVGSVLGVGWAAIGRVVPVAADVVTIALVGRLARSAPRLRRFQYACNPVTIMVAAVHGQLEPVALAMGVAALVLARQRRGFAAGLVLGLGIAVNSWPALLLPSLLLALPGARERLRAVPAVALLPAAFFLTIPLAAAGGAAEYVRAAKRVLSVRPVTGEWGWSAVTALATGSGGQLVVSAGWATVGTAAVLVGFLVVALAWRRADPVTLAAVVLVVFLAATARFGAQYLLWPVPFLLARPTRWTGQALLAMAAWAGTGYLYLTTLSPAGYAAAHGWWAVSSVPVIVAMLAALPPPVRGVAAETVAHGVPVHVAGSPGGGVTSNVHAAAPPPKPSW